MQAEGQTPSVREMFAEGVICFTSSDGGRGRDSSMAADNNRGMDNNRDRTGTRSNTWGVADGIPYGLLGLEKK